MFIAVPVDLDVPLCKDSKKVYVNSLTSSNVFGNVRHCKLKLILSKSAVKNMYTSSVCNSVHQYTNIN